MQMPKIGFWPSSVLMFSTICGTALGSPCTFHKPQWAAAAAEYAIVFQQAHNAGRTTQPFVMATPPSLCIEKHTGTPFVVRRTGPLDRKMPSGFMASTSSAACAAGTTVTRHPADVSRRRMLCLMPKSYATTCGTRSRSGQQVCDRIRQALCDGGC